MASSFNPISDTRILANAEALSLCFVLDENGQSVPLSSFWKTQTAILVFLRHFHCDACRAHAVDVWKNKSIYEEHGAKIYFIGNGDPSHISEFKSKYQLQEAPIFTDPSLKAFRSAGFKKGFWISPGAMHTRSEFLFHAFVHATKMTKSGNLWQLGGVLVVKTDGEISYQYTSQAMGDFPPCKDVMKQEKSPRA